MNGEAPIEDLATCSKCGSRFPRSEGQHDPDACARLRKQREQPPAADRAQHKIPPVTDRK